MLSVNNDDVTGLERQDKVDGDVVSHWIGLDLVSFICKLAIKLTTTISNSDLS